MNWASACNKMYKKRLFYVSYKIKISLVYNDVGNLSQLIE